jgi:hypothetical protein
MSSPAESNLGQASYEGNLDRVKILVEQDPLSVKSRDEVGERDHYSSNC